MENHTSIRGRPKEQPSVAGADAVGGDVAIRVLVGEDQPIVREGVLHVLAEAGFHIVGVVEDADELIRQAQAETPDVVITDIQMPPRRSDDGLQAACHIRATQPGVGVLVLSEFLEDRYAIELVGDRAEGVGYLLKHRLGDLGSFAEAVRRIARGGAVLDPEVVARLVGRRRRRSPLDELSGRERDVLRLMAEGLSNPGIARELAISIPAVERHVTAIFVKLALPPSPEAHRRVLAVLQYLRRN
jgi:DNA-binding NarL/FixJ family response regulator